MITIEQLKALNISENIAITEHARIRLYERNISIDDVVNGINTGEIIKQYEKRSNTKTKQHTYNRN